MSSYAKTIQNATHQLREAGIDDPAQDARILMMWASGQTRSDLMLNENKDVSKTDTGKFNDAIKRRQLHEPIAYITQGKAFWSLSLTVNQHVLIPRPETEAIVEQALSTLQGRKNPRILDVGTGSGAILLSILAEMKNAGGIGLDISSSALDVARANAKTHGLTKLSDFILSNYLDVFNDAEHPVFGQKFDLVVANPPYIDDDAMQELPRDVADFEPHLALKGGVDGLAAYRAIIEDLQVVLVPGGHVVFEIGYDQGDAVSNLLDKHGFSQIRVEKDLAGHDRIVSAFLSEKVIKKLGQGTKTR
jgi:release factor glutamine methyltransferase